MTDSHGLNGSLAAGDEAELSSPSVPGPPTSTSRSGVTSHPHSLNVSRSPSNVASPRSSRDSSPAGRAFRQQSAGPPQGMRSRQNSHEASPHRPPSITGHTQSIPSAAAIQRALSAATPQLQPTSVTEAPSKLPRSQRAQTATPDTPPSWPLSPRLKSPPPSGSRRDSLRSQRKPEISASAPSIVVQRSSEAPHLDGDDQGDSEAQSTAPAKAGNRGGSGATTLETVQEASLPPTPVDELDSKPSANIDTNYFDLLSEEEGQTTPRNIQHIFAKHGDSGSDNDRSNDRRRDHEIDPDNTPKAKVIAPRSSYSSLKHKSGAEPTTKNMTVETETVSSIPQATLGPPSDRVASGRTEHGGTLRVKASNETIRPGKGRKKVSRKAPSINATSASTRADIFEDRVKNAMDEATSDDSDETFVYESNPPEPPVRRSRHHSRTPSGASLASMGDQRNLTRSIQSALSTHKTRSMKFANALSTGADEEVLERHDGTTRASNHRNGGSSIHHHHLGRPLRNNTGHTSILDDDNSPFPQVAKTRSLIGMPGRQSQNAKFAARNLQASNGNGRKRDGYSSYDMDADGGDDERTPLMGTVRTPRSVRRSIQTPHQRYPEHYSQHHRSILSRFAGFIVLIVMLLLLAFGVVGFLFAISTPLAEVSIIEIQAVLASEQEIMFDLVVGAVNPNLLPINVGEMDLNVFVKSTWVGSEKWWREHGNQTIPRKEKSRGRKSRSERLREDQRDDKTALAADDDLSDDLPPDYGGPEGSRKTMLLGRIDHFDNPLSFDGSFLKRHAHFSTGSLRLSKPGNRTELGGTERWERVILHPFELIVRGTLKYKIPLGGRAYAANVGSNTTVHPETGMDAGVDRDGRITSRSAYPLVRTPKLKTRLQRRLEETILAVFMR